MLMMRSFDVVVDDVVDVVDVELMMLVRSVDVVVVGEEEMVGKNDDEDYVLW